MLAREPRGIAVDDGETVSVLPNLTYGKVSVLQRHSDAIALEDFAAGLPPCRQGGGDGHQRKKKMEGHNVAGYACDITISPDGRFVCSGDSNGKLFFWDFKRTRILQKFHAHDKGPTIGAVWHPVEPATVLTCGWDGVIKMWQ
jgi:WD40 repeat protein